MNDMLTALSHLRELGDYNFSSVTEQEEAEQACSYAADFLKATIQWFIGKT